MEVRCKAFFGGLEVQVSFSMTRSHGTAPDIGQLVWRSGTTLPSSAVGDLVMKNDATTIVTFKNCALRNPAEKFGQTRDVVYQILDRRWKWKTPTVFGQWNVRDEKNLLVAGTEKNPQQLATLLLIALGETGYDVSALPTDVELAPSVVWHYTPAAIELDKLCAMLGCTVNLLNNDTVKIITENTGTEPDNTGLTQPVETGLIINPAPDYITCYGGDTMFDSWLTLEAIGRDEDGTYKPIDMLSYTPYGSWSANGDPAHGYDTTIRGPLDGVIPDERIDKIVELANRTVFRLYRINGFPKGQKFFPGFTIETSVATVGDLPGTGDVTKVYLVANQRTVVWDGSAYRGITWYNSYSALYILVDILKIADPSGPTPEINSGTKTAMVAAQKAAGIANYTVIAPQCTAIDPRLLLPVMQTRVENALDELQQNTKRSAEACGIFNEENYRLQNKTPINLTMWKHGISIDQKRGHVIFGQPAYAWSPGLEPATMYLRCGYGYRQTAYGSRYHRNYKQATGNTLGIANGVVARTDVAEYRVQNYSSDYNDLSVLGSVINNTSTMDTILHNSALENLKQYQNFVAPKRKPYTPFRAIDTDGKVLQVSYAGGVNSIGTTIASIGGSFDTSQPPAKLKRIQELQRRQAEMALQNFRATQIQASNINATGGSQSTGFSGQDIE